MMKEKLLPVLLTLTLILGIEKVFAAIPLLSESFKKEEIISESEFNGTRFLKVATNQGIEEIKKILIKQMGEEWEEIPDDIDFGRKDKLVVPGAKKKPSNILGTARFKNPKHPGIHIHLVLMSIPAKDKIHTALITTMKPR